MRRLSFVSAAALGVLMLSAVPVRAQTIELTATLGGPNETPGVLTGAAATARIFLNTNGTVDYTIPVFNMPSGTTQAHFHVGGPGLAGPIVVDIPVPVTASNDFTLTGTVGPASLRPQPNLGIRAWDDFLQALTGGQTYLNVHSQANPSGEIRGQVTVVR